MLPTLTALSDEELLEGMKNLKGEENRIIADSILHLYEIESRGIYREAGYSCLFKYCTECLGYSEGVACRRMRGARSLGDSPEIYELIRDGKLSLCALAEVSRVMTDENRKEVLSATTGASKKQAALIAVQLGGAEPKKRECIRMRKVEVKAPPPDLFGAQTKSTEQAAPVVENIASFSFDVSDEVAALYEEAKALSGARSIAEVFETTLREYVTRKLKERTVQASKSPSPAKVEPAVAPGSHSIPISVRREVFERDGQRCTYVSPDGHQCSERRHLHIDHAEPVARGGTNNIPNLRVLCWAHNQLFAEQRFGRDYIVRRRAEARERKQATFAGESATN